MRKSAFFVLLFVFSCVTKLSAEPPPQLHHIICVKLKKSVTQAELDNLKKSTLALKEKIPVILSITAGKNITKRSRGFNFAIVVKLKDRSALDAYLNHPSHQKLLREVAKPLVEEIIALDFEI